MSYSGDDTDLMLLAAGYIGRILKGEKPDGFAGHPADQIRA